MNICIRQWLDAPFHKTKSGQLFWGAFAALGSPPIHIVPCFIIGLFMHRYVLRDIKHRTQAFMCGWFFHMGFVGVVLHWVVTCLGVDWEKFWWLSPFIFFGLPALLALFSAFGVMCASLVPHKGLWTVWYASVCYSAAEWIGGVVTRFPGLSYGYVLANQDIPMQSASVFGIYGLGFCMLLTVFLVVEAFKGERAASRRAKIMACLITGSILSYGIYHLSEGQQTHATTPCRIRLVQPNISQSFKWDREQAVKHLNTLLQLSQNNTSYRPDILIWPETAIPYAVPAHASDLSWCQDLKDRAQFVISGTIERQELASGVVHYNSLLLVDAQLNIRDRYRKKHLVPFGEFIPLRRWLSFVDGWIDLVDCEPGLGPVTLKADTLPAFSPLICYDVIFSGDVASRNDPHPQWLLNITNDAWFAHGWGPQQHLALARLRAVEEGMPLVRAANTGISAIVDAHGRILHALPFQSQGIIDFVLPAALKGTLFRTYGHYATCLVILMIGVCLAIGDYLSSQSKRVWRI